MKCITRNEMKFGDYHIPARTPAKVICKVSKTVVQTNFNIRISIDLYDIKKNGTLMSEILIEDKLSKQSHMVGITISTNAKGIYIRCIRRFITGYYTTKIYSR